MENSQDDDFFMFSSNSSQICGNLYNEDLYDKDLESSEKYDTSDESSEAEKELSALASATITKNEQFLNKPSRKRLPSWTKRYFDTFRLEKKRKCNVLINTKEGKVKCGHPFVLQTSTSNLASHLRVVHQIHKPDNLKTLASTSIQTNQPTIEQILNKVTPLSEKKQSQIMYRLISWLIDNLQAFNVLSNEKFHDLIHECESRFQFPYIDQVKQKISSSVIYSESNLKNLIKETLTSFNFTTDLWSQFHTPYIGVTIHWLSNDFILYQALLTIQQFPYPHTGDAIEDCLRDLFIKWNISSKLFGGSTDNATAMVKACKQLRIFHIGCTAYTLHISVNDRLKKIDELIVKAKRLNSFLSNRDKYRSDLMSYFVKQYPELKELQPISSDTATRWNSTYLLLKQLLLFRHPAHQLVQQLQKDVNQQIRNDSDSLCDLLLEDFEWQCLEELAILLQPFAQSITFMGGSHYPTLGIMYPTIRKLFQHLDTVYDKLVTFKVQKVCEMINQSMSKHWDEPKEAGLIASYLDPRFKNLHFLNSEEKMETINLLRTRIIESSDSHTCTTTSSYIQNTQEHMMSKFFDDSDTATQSSLDTELQLYNSLPLVPKYDLNHPKYEKDNPLLFWRKYSKSLPLLASQARIYLAIPATSVPSERLLSDAGNLLTDKLIDLIQIR